MPVANLFMNQILQSGEVLSSPSGLYRAVIGTDGQLRVCKYPKTGGRIELWSMAGNPVPGSHFVVTSGGSMELRDPDGDIVSRRGCTPISNINACLQKVDPFVAMQDDGNFVLYNRTDAFFLPIWASDTNESDEARHGCVIPGEVYIEISSGTLGGDNFNRTVQNTSSGPAVIIAGNRSVTALPDGKVQLYAPGVVAVEATIAKDPDVPSGTGDAQPTASVNYDATKETFVLKRTGNILQLL